MSEEDSQNGEESREARKEAVAVIPHNSSSNEFCNKKEKTNGVDSRNVGSKFFLNERCYSMSSKENDAEEKTGDANKGKATIFKGKVFESVKGDGIHTQGRGHWP